jgi:hypothetical protein
MSRVVGILLATSCLVGSCTCGSCNLTPEYQVPIGAGWNIEPDFENLRNDEFMLTREDLGYPGCGGPKVQGILDVARGLGRTRTIAAGRTHDGYFVLSPDRGLLWGEDGQLKEDPLPVLAKLEVFKDREAWQQRLAQLGCHDVVLRPPTPWDSPGVRNAAYAAIAGACAAAPLGVVFGVAVTAMWHRRRMRRSAGSPTKA